MDAIRNPRRKLASLLCDTVFRAANIYARNQRAPTAGWDCGFSWQPGEALQRRADCNTICWILSNLLQAEAIGILGVNLNLSRVHELQTKESFRERSGTKTSSRSESNPTTDH